MVDLEARAYLLSDRYAKSSQRRVELVWNHSIGYRGSRIIMHAIADKEPTALDKSGSLD